MKTEARLARLRRADTLDSWGVALLFFGIIAMLGAVAAGVGFWLNDERLAGVIVGVSGIVQATLLVVVGLLASAVSDLLADTARDDEKAPGPRPTG